MSCLLRGNKQKFVAILLGAIGLVASNLFMQPHSADANGDERTLTLYEIHLRETTTVTFKRDGKYIPQGLKKLNHAMRDWRTGVSTRMDPKLFDLIWKLKQQLGHDGAIHVISGHRSAKTNRKLRRRGGGQAKKSQHVRGRAMDIHFPGVNMSKVRKLAFQFEVGGVGYYPTSALPFVHVDTARVRSWPRMGRSQLAMLFPHSKTRHRPSSGGPLTARDRKRARIRIAALTRKRNASIQVASAKLPAPHASFPKSPSKTITLASLPNNAPSTRMRIPGLSRHAARLWVNGSGDRALPKINLQKQRLRQTVVARTSTPRVQTPKARVQTASLSPANDRLAPTPRNPRANLWVNGSNQRADWLTEVQKAIKAPLPAAPALTQKPVDRQSQIKRKIAPRITQQPVQRKYGYQRVAAAPQFDAEHPDELSYRPFPILQFMSSKPVVLNKNLVAMSEPKYDRIFEVIASSENIPMQFRQSSKDAADMWNSQFKGNAINNVRQRAHNVHFKAPSQRVALR